MRILLIWALISGLLFGLAEFGEPLDDLFRAIRNKARDHNASGQVVVIGIDSLAQQESGNWPWSASDYATMIDNLGDAGAKRIFFDFPINGLARDKGKNDLVDALKKHRGKVYLAADFSEDFDHRPAPHPHPSPGIAALCPADQHQCVDQRVQHRVERPLCEQGG